MTLLGLAGMWAALAGACAAVYVAPHALRFAQVHELRARCRQQRRVVLTYDDGPTAVSTPPLLDLLASYQVKASFFLLGRNAAAHPHIVDRIVAEGHQIGSHSQHHCHPWLSSPQRVRQDVELGYLNLSPWVASDAPFRPPYGKLVLPSWLALNRRGAPLGWWTIDSGDTGRLLPAHDKVLELVHRAQGAVVLMHDGHHSRERRDHMLGLTEALLKFARAEGFEVCRLGDLWRARRDCAGARVPAR